MPTTVKQRSALHHRPIEADDTRSRPHPAVVRASRKHPAASGVATRGSALRTTQEDLISLGVPPTAALPRRSRARPLAAIGLGMLIAILLGIALTQAWAWGQSAWETLFYGYPRVSQIDAAVGHGDSPRNPSHFLTINLDGQIEIFEWPGGDATHMKVYLGPRLFGPDADQPPATLRFADLLNNGKLDMIIQVQGNLSVLINDAGIFRPVRPNEEQQVLERLRELEGNGGSGQGTQEPAA